MNSRNYFSNAISILVLFPILQACTPGSFSASGKQVLSSSSQASQETSMPGSQPQPQPQPAPGPQPMPAPVPNSQPQPQPAPAPAPAPQPAPAPTPVSLISVGQLIDDMTKPHESTAHGVHPDWAWGQNPRIGVGLDIPSSFDDPHFTPWGVVATSTSGSSARNVRVQLRKLILDVKRNGVWTRMVYNSADSLLMGSLYTSYENNTTAPANLRKHGADGISVRLPDNGGSFHWMTTDRFRFARGAQEVLVRYEARLIVDDPSRADDRSSARLLALAGGDYWKNLTQTWNPNVTSNVDFAIGRFKYVTSEWAVFTAHTLGSSAEANEYIMREPALNPR